MLNILEGHGSGPSPSSEPSPESHQLADFMFVRGGAWRLCIGELTKN